MKKVSFMIVIGAVLISVVFAASAFTSAELSRTANVNVAADNNAALSLTPGTVGNVATLNSNDELTINAAPSASGLNVGGTFTFGDKSNPTNSYLFSMTNTTASSQDVTVAYTVTGNAQGQTDAMTYTIYDSSGSSVATVTNGASATFTASSGSTYYVVLETNTTGLDSNADLSGNLTFSI